MVDVVSPRYLRYRHSIDDPTVGDVLQYRDGGVWENVPIISALETAGLYLDQEIVVTFDGGGVALPVGDTKTYYTLPYNATILGWYLTGDPSGSLVVDIWRRAGAIPNVAYTIITSGKPTLSSAAYGLASSVPNWSADCLAGDVFGFNIDSCSTITKAILTLKLLRTA